MENEKRPDKKLKLNQIIFITAIVVFIIAASLLVIHLLPSHENFSDYKNEISSSSSTPELPQNPIDFAALKDENPEICAWIKVDGTNVDYPVLRSEGETEEDFYLSHDYLRNKKTAGSIYIQRVNSSDFSDPNTVIYGHNMRNGSMFGTLKKFRNADFFNENTTITVYTPGHILTYKIFSAFVYDNRHIINSFDFYDTDSYSDFLSQCTNPKSLTRNLRTEIKPTTSDRIITLSTCTGVETQRYLVTGLLIDDTTTK